MLFITVVGPDSSDIKGSPTPRVIQRHLGGGIGIGLKLCFKILLPGHAGGWGDNSKRHYLVRNLCT